MSVLLSPAGLATTALTANQLSATASFKEKLRNNVCACAGSNIPVTVSYAYGQPTLVGNTVFVPITATIVFPSNCNNNCRFVENFDVSFQGQTALPASVDINSVGRVTHINGKCLLINDSITIALVAAATA